MFKSLIAASAALSLSAGAAVAGPYINVEANAAYPDGEYIGAVTDFHLGFEGTAGDAVGFYVQGGPSFIHSEAADDTETELSGKVGVTYAATDSLGLYGELAGITNGEDSDGDEIIDWGGKVGVKFDF
tara:strand:+ start:3359 stop:3742 length:384 start_codon:yes stop_codon:yes gene_type:complete